MLSRVSQVASIRVVAALRYIVITCVVGALEGIP